MEVNTGGSFGYMADLIYWPTPLLTEGFKNFYSHIRPGNLVSIYNQVAVDRSKKMVSLNTYIHFNLAQRCVSYSLNCLSPFYQTVDCGVIANILSGLVLDVLPSPGEILYFQLTSFVKEYTVYGLQMLDRGGV